MHEEETIDEGGVTPPAEDGEEAQETDNAAPDEAEERIRQLESAAEELRNQVTTQETQIGQLQASLETALIRYRNGILRDNPEIPGHLLTGSTVEELDASLEEARTVVNSVRQHLEEQVPAGAPARTGVDVSSLSPRQKIEYGVTHGTARRKN